ncbi:MAG: FeS assembly system protein [Acidobacteria bacterium]|nr:FeS assembly system protein [Acidobacteriota bacterium]
MEPKSSKKKPRENEASANLEEKVIDVLREVYDPEIPVNIYELGLVYGIDANPEQVVIRMTLTSPGCPVAGSLPIEIQSRVGEIEGVKSVKVELVWDPPWDPEMITEAGKLQLGIF